MQVSANDPVDVKERTAADSRGIGARQTPNETTLERKHDIRNHP
jgi:hypothetical protein